MRWQFITAPLFWNVLFFYRAYKRPHTLELTNTQSSCSMATGRQAATSTAQWATRARIELFFFVLIFFFVPCCCCINRYSNAWPSSVIHFFLCIFFWSWTVDKTRSRQLGEFYLMLMEGWGEKKLLISTWSHYFFGVIVGGGQMCAWVCFGTLSADGATRAPVVMCVLND